MSVECTERWKRLYQKNCSDWPEGLKRRYINVVNDPEDVDELEVESAIELIEEINKKKVVE